ARPGEVALDRGGVEALGDIERQPEPAPHAAQAGDGALSLAGELQALAQIGVAVEGSLQQARLEGHLQRPALRLLLVWLAEGGIESQPLAPDREVAVACALLPA